ncbi:MAG: Nif3-like dinuclear metal center hexameric protein [Bacteroidaceae bacterium]|nr:Nif3-like dinuclear metal center hexameric protein [Bacteroidaceae bacterium]
MKIKEAVRALELFAPLPLQESYDNAGLQIGLTERELSGALLCLDVTEETVAEAVAKGCNLIVAHHPLLFRGLKCVSDADYVQRTVRAAIRADVAIYAAHTNLDNARGGVNFRAAEMLGLQGADFLRPLPGVEGGSGVVGDLPEAVGTEAFLNIIRSAFGVERIEANLAQPAAIRRVAFCGGAGDFLIDDAVRAGADAFVTGEVGYHHFFGHDDELLVCALGHHDSEWHAAALLRDILRPACPGVPLLLAERRRPTRNL